MFARLRDSSARAAARSPSRSPSPPSTRGTPHRGAARGGLIAADVGVPATAEIVQRLEARGDAGDLGEALRGDRAPARRAGAARSGRAAGRDPVVGVNGTGKTTTIGKLAAKPAEHGRSVLVAAADTFRAAAEEQLEIWARAGERRLRRLGAGRRPGRGRLRRDRRRRVARAGRGRRRHGRPAAHAGEPDGGADEGAPGDRPAPGGRPARDAARDRRDHRAERAPAGAPVQPGRRGDGDRVDQARRLGEGRDRDRHRPRARIAGQADRNREQLEDLRPFDAVDFSRALVGEAEPV